MARIQLPFILACAVLIRYEALMAKTGPFDRHSKAYEEWFSEHGPVYRSELKAIGHGQGGFVAIRATRGAHGDTGTGP